jgi:transposase
VRRTDEIAAPEHRGELSQMEAAEILGMSERTFRRWRDRYDAEGAEGLYDRMKPNRSLSPSTPSLFRAIRNNRSIS